MYSKELVYVTTIAESGSLSAAAKKLSMTQPALSILLSNLEVAGAWCPQKPGNSI